MNNFLKSKEDDFSKAIDFFKKDIATLRTGRANPSVLEGLSVEVYGAKTPLNGAANISIADSKSITVAPWDKGLIKDIEKAIVDGDIGLGVVNEGDKIRLTVPQMTEDNRRDLVKKLNERMEKVRISIRQIRDDIKDDIESAEKNKEISEDDRFRFVKELDDKVRSINDDIKNIRDAKEVEIMTV